VGKEEGGRGEKKTFPREWRSAIARTVGMKPRNGMICVFNSETGKKMAEVEKECAREGRSSAPISHALHPWGCELPLPRRSQMGGEKGRARNGRGNEAGALKGKKGKAAKINKRLSRAGNLFCWVEARGKFEKERYSKGKGDWKNSGGRRKSPYRRFHSRRGSLDSIFACGAYRNQPKKNAKEGGTGSAL